MPSDDRSDLGIFYPFVGHAWHIGVVEVDVETGKLSFLHYAAVRLVGALCRHHACSGLHSADPQRTTANPVSGNLRDLTPVAEIGGWRLAGHASGRAKEVR